MQAAVVPAVSSSWQIKEWRNLNPDPTKFL